VTAGLAGELDRRGSAAGLVPVRNRPAPELHIKKSTGRPVQ
jgi:hypothetical protein